MKDNIEELKKRYGYKTFKVAEPILDIGGGDGDFLKSQGIKRATIMEGCNAPQNTPYEYIKADITKKLPEIKTKFNTIFITETLEHLENPLYLLAQVYDILSDSGVCYISIPYTEIGEEHHHVCRWKLKEIVNQTKKLGFIPYVLQKRKRFYGLGFWMPHCWLVLALKKKIVDSNSKNKSVYNLDFR